MQIQIHVPVCPHPYTHAGEEGERKLKFVIFDRFSFTVVILNCHVCQNTGYDTGIVLLGEIQWNVREEG